MLNVEDYAHRIRICLKPLNEIKMKKYFTKSKFKTALECPSKLYYYDKKKEYANLNSENEFLQALADGGYQVGELAKLYYPGGHDIKSLDYQESLDETNEYLKQNNVVIYEAAVKYNNCFIRVDVLRKTGNCIELIEVKAKSFDVNSTENGMMGKNNNYIKTNWKPYLYDVAFQSWVMEKAFPDFIVKSYLLLADKTQVATVDGLNQLFRISEDERHRTIIKLPKNIEEIDLGEKILITIDVKPQVDKIWEGSDTLVKKKSNEELKGFEERIIEYSDYYCSDKKYPAKVGQKCKNCEYKNSENTLKQGLKSGYKECWREGCGKNFDFTKPHIFEIWNFKKNQELIDSNIYYMKDIPIEYFTDNSGNFKSSAAERQMLQINKALYDSVEYVSPDLKNEMNKWIFPLHFIDFETSMVAIPFNKGRRPYEQIAFQFSSHTLYEDGTIKHDEFIHDIVGEFPNYDFLRALKSTLDKDNGTIFRYAAHENTVLRQIQGQMLNDNSVKFDELLAWIDTITQNTEDNKNPIYGERNMVDMCDLVKKYYYHPRMKGSNSIKAVLPAILSAGSFVKDKYSMPLEFGTHLKNRILWKLNNITTEPENPYKLLPPIFYEINIDKDIIERFFDGDEIKEGGAAATAYARMQFTEMSDIERTALKESLLQYCELDTLAMLMIYEHWKSVEKY